MIKELKDNEFTEGVEEGVEGEGEEFEDVEEG